MRLLTRLFFASVLAFSFAVLGATVSPSVSSAEDVWVLSRDGFDNYMQSETIIEGGRGYRVNVKVVHNGEFQGSRTLYFFKKSNMYMVMYESDELGDIGELSSDDELGAPLWEAMKPYMDARGIRYPNLGYK